MIEVRSAGSLTTIQDLGRPGWAHLGVPPSGAADRRSLALANRLVGNPEGAPALETTIRGPVLAFAAPAIVALAGAPVEARIRREPRQPSDSDGPGAASRSPAEGSHPGVASRPPAEESGPGAKAPRAEERAVAMHAVEHVQAGDVLDVGWATRGVRTYVAVRGGIEAEEVLGSASHDILTGLGPPPLADGDRLTIGRRGAGWPVTEVAPVPAGPSPLRIVPGPRDDWFTPAALDALIATAWTVGPGSNRVGVRLSGPPLERARSGELSSEGLITGALQVPPSGEPILMLTDHPATGGYPVVAVVISDDLPIAGQLRPGDTVSLRWAG